MKKERNPHGAARTAYRHARGTKDRRKEPARAEREPDIKDGVARKKNHPYPRGASARHINAWKMAHMIGVAEYMRERARDYGLDPDAMYAAGLLHDIGYLAGRADHEAKGADILAKAGMSGPVAEAVRLHGKRLDAMKAEDEEVTPELALMVEADLSVDAEGYRAGFAGRIADIGERYGKDHPAYKAVAANAEYIRRYCEENGIPDPDTMVRDGKTENRRDRGKATEKVAPCTERKKEAVAEAPEGKGTAAKSADEARYFLLKDEDGIIDLIRVNNWDIHFGPELVDAYDNRVMEEDPCIEKIYEDLHDCGYRVDVIDYETLNLL